VKDLETARNRVSAQRHSKTCPSCGAKTELAGALCPACDAVEPDVLEQQRLKLQYQEYRQATVTRLTHMWQELRATPTDDEKQLWSLLGSWSQEFASCQPPIELHKIQGLKANRLTLQMLAEGAKCLAEAMAADLTPEVWPKCKSIAAQRATERVAMLCRLAKTLGKDVREANSVVASLDRDHTAFDDWLSEHPEKLGVLDRTAGQIEQKLCEELSLELAKTGVILPVLSGADYARYPRRLHV
jgi:hypothetical protein